jgi:hypothetical protein
MAEMSGKHVIKKGERTPIQRFFTFIALLTAVVFVLNIILSELRADNRWGLFYGAFAAILLLLAALLGLRRRVMRFSSRYSFFKAEPWREFHLYGGALFLVLMLMHSGFHLPTGTLNGCIFALGLWTALSGWVGWGLQKWIPRMLTSGLSIEVHYDRIPELIGEIRKRAMEQLAACEDPIRSFCIENILPVLQRPTPRLIYFFDITGGLSSMTRECDYLSRFLPPDQKQQLNDLLNLYKTKLAMDAHYTLQRPLRLWLYAHLPVSMVLAVLVVIHIVSVFYF